MTKQRILSNVLSLSLVQAADYVVPLLAIPYLLMTIGAEGYGHIAFVQAFSAYLLVVTEYGFNFTATRTAAVQQHDKHKLSQSFWAIQAVKTIMAALSAGLVIFLYFTVDQLHEMQWIWFSTLLPVIGTVMYPLWLLQGIERMKQAAAIMLVVRFTLLFAIFLLVSKHQDTALAAGLMMGATPIAGLLSWILLKKGKYIGWYLPKVSQIVEQFKDGWHVFLASASSNIYRSSNPVVLGFMLGPVSVAYYSLAEKLVKASQELSRPIVQASYPRVSQYVEESPTKACKLLQKLLFSIAGITLIASVILLVFAPEIIHLISGAENARAVNILRWMAIVPFVGGVNSVLGVQTMLPFHYNKDFSRFVIRAGIVSLLIIIPLIAWLAENGAAISYLLSELILLIQFFIFHKNKGISILNGTIKSSVREKS